MRQRETERERRGEVSNQEREYTGPTQERKWKQRGEAGNWELGQAQPFDENAHEQTCWDLTSANRPIAELKSATAARVSIFKSALSFSSACWDSATVVFPAHLPRVLGACPGAFRLPGNLGGWGGYVWRVHGLGGGGCGCRPYNGCRSVLWREGTGK